MKTKIIIERRAAIAQKQEPPSRIASESSIRAMAKRHGLKLEKGRGVAVNYSGQTAPTGLWTRHVTWWSMGANSTVTAIRLKTAPSSSNTTKVLSPAGFEPTRGTQPPTNEMKQTKTYYRVQKELRKEGIDLSIADISKFAGYCRDLRDLYSVVLNKVAAYSVGFIDKSLLPEGLSEEFYKAAEKLNKTYPHPSKSMKNEERKTPS